MTERPAAIGIHMRTGGVACRTNSGKKQGQAVLSRASVLVTTTESANEYTQPSRTKSRTPKKRTCTEQLAACDFTAAPRPPGNLRARARGWGSR